MRRKGLTIRKAIVLFFSLSTLSIIIGAVLAIKLPRKIEVMNEVKASVVELEKSKEKQVKELEQIQSQMDEINNQVQSLELVLEKVKEEDVEAEQSNEKVKYAYLTFDDGPSENTIKILDFLKANNIKATFFVIGTKGYDQIYKRIVDEGHTLAIHSNTHKYSDIYLSVYAFMQDIHTLSSRLEKLTGVKPAIMRFPGGSNNTVSHKYGGGALMDKLTKKVSEEGYIYYDWNVDSSDASSNNRSKEAIFNAVMNGVEGKEHAIILMHDAAAKKTTVEALPQIVQGLRKKGFVLAPITEDTPTVQFKK